MLKFQFVRNREPERRERPDDTDDSWDEFVKIGAPAALRPAWEDAWRFLRGSDVATPRHDAKPHGAVVLSPRGLFL